MRSAVRLSDDVAAVFGMVTVGKCNDDDRPAGVPREPRVLVLAESLPYPTVKGGDLRTWQNLNALAACGSAGIFGLCSNDRRRLTTPDLPLACWTISTDPALAFPPPKGVKLAGRAWLLDPEGHPSDLYRSEAVAGEIAALLAEFRPDIVVFEGLWLHGYIGLARAAGCKVVLDCHNVEALTYRALASANARQDFEGRVLREVLPARTEAIERRAIEQASQIWVCSNDDEQRLRELYAPAAPIVVVPNGIRLKDYAPLSPRARGGAADRPSAREGPSTARQTLRPPAAATSLTLLYPASFSYPPNAIAATFLVEEIFPRLAAACEDCQLLLVGAMPSPALLAAADAEPRITVTGVVPDVRPYYAEATALAVALFQGGGTRMKILEAFALGVPVISTPKGAEGLDVQDGVQLLIAESAGEFVDAALALQRDPELADRLAANARAHVAERFSWPVVSARIRDAVSEVMAR